MKTFYYVVYTLVGIIQLVLGLRFVLLIFDVEPTATFASIVYLLSDPLIFPLESMFPNAEYGLFFIDLATFFGLILYTVLGTLLLRYLARKSGTNRRRKYRF